MKLEYEMASIGVEEFFNTHENIIEICGPAVGPENSKASQMLTRPRRGGGKDGKKSRSMFRVEAGSERMGK